MSPEDAPSNSNTSHYGTWRSLSLTLSCQVPPGVDVNRSLQIATTNVAAGETSIAVPG
jgi:hypothetical protein